MPHKSSQNTIGIKSKISYNVCMVSQKPRCIVLVIDDEKQVRDSLRDILEFIDLDVLTASNGDEGIHCFKSAPNEIKLVLLDVSMPGLSSEETFKVLRSLSPKLPILITSGVTQADLPPQFRTDPHCEFLQKPFTLDKIIERVEFHLKNST